MSVSIAIGLFFIVWWIVLFALLPFKMGEQQAPPGSDPFAEAAGAPSSPRLARKFILAAAISALIVGALYAAFAFDLISIGDIPASVER